MSVRRWRGWIDVPLSKYGRGDSLEELGGLELDLVYHDRLSRCKDTADMIRCQISRQDDGSGPWNMGWLFEGHSITEESLDMARVYIRYANNIPPGGESFRRWSMRWMEWLECLQIGFASVGIVTHNRNIQYLYSIHGGHFEYKLYDCDGPGFNSVHYYNRDLGLIAPWNGRGTPNGLYLLRHGETEWGT